MEYGPAGLEPYGLEPGAFPYELRDFSVRPGLEGPQVVCTWTPPLQPLSRLMIRRKVGEYPRHPSDGVLVLDTMADPNSRTTAVDMGEDLLTEGYAQRWWYYRAFVKPAPLPLADQFDGRGLQTLEQDDPDIALLEPIDVQRYRNITILAQNLDADEAQVYISTAPELTGPWHALVSNDPVAADTTSSWVYTDASFKYLRVAATARHLVVSTIVNRVSEWSTSFSMSQPCLVYRTGRHINLTFDGDHLPKLFTNADETVTQAYLAETTDTNGESFMLGRDHDPRGFLYRMLYVFMLELDRSHAYFEAMTAFNSDLDEAPEALLQHIAFELGWQVDMTQPLNDIREELFRLAGMWKARGTSHLFGMVGAQQLGVVPRIQEGAGLVLRMANPKLFPRTFNTDVDPDAIAGDDVLAGP